MNKKILAIMIAADYVIQGCASYRQLESTERKPLRNNTGNGEMMSDLRTRTPVVKESSRQWINPRPVMDKNTGQNRSRLSHCHSYRQSITLQQVVQRITESCHIPVQGSPPDVLTYLNTSTTGSTLTNPGRNYHPHRMRAAWFPLPPLAHLTTDATIRLPGNTAALSELNASGLTTPAECGLLPSRYNPGAMTARISSFYYSRHRPSPSPIWTSQVAYNATVVSGTIVLKKRLIGGVHQRHFR